MFKILQRASMCLFAMSVSACSNAPIFGDLFGGNVIHVAETRSAKPNAPRQDYAASIRLLPYSDGRNRGNPHKIGMTEQIVIGMSGNELTVDPEVSAIVTNSMRKRLENAGFQLAATEPLFELSGVVKVLNYDVKVRDEVSITVESTLKERATGKIVWSGSVVEKSDRFAGVSGNSKKDIANYLREEVGVVTGKTTEAISAILMANRPDLFSLTPGTRPIQGVTVFSAPAANSAPAGQGAPTATPPGTPALADTTSGMLSITSIPARARIYIDDVYYGLAPLRLELAPGVHTVSAKMAAYKTGTEKVSVRKGETTELEMELQR